MKMCCFSQYNNEFVELAIYFDSVFKINLEMVRGHDLLSELVEAIWEAGFCSTARFYYTLGPYRSIGKTPLFKSDQNTSNLLYQLRARVASLSMLSSDS